MKEQRERYHTRRLCSTILVLSHSQTAYRQVTKPGYPQAAVAAAVVTGNINNVPSPSQWSTPSSPKVSPYGTTL